MTLVSPPGGPPSPQDAIVWRLPSPPHRSPPHLHPRPRRPLGDEDTQPPWRGQLLPEPLSQGCEHGFSGTSGAGLVRTGAEAVEQTLRWAGRGAAGVSGRVHHFGRNPASEEERAGAGVAAEGSSL